MNERKKAKEIRERDAAGHSSREPGAPSPTHSYYPPLSPSLVAAPIRSNDANEDRWLFDSFVDSIFYRGWDRSVDIEEFASDKLECRSALL